MWWVTQEKEHKVALPDLVTTIKCIAVSALLLSGAQVRVVVIVPAACCFKLLQANMAAASTALAASHAPC
jgi:hypothetical protein